MRWQTQEQYLRMLLARQLDIPMLGKIFYAVPNGSSTSRYEEWARRELDIPAELLFVGALAPAQAFAACEAYRNDVVCVFPGAYDIDTELAWSKANTHMVGMSGPNIAGDYTEPGVNIYSDNIACGSVLTVTGPNSQFHNLAVSNVGADTACLTALTANTYGLRFKNVGMQGNMNSTINAVAASASLYIGAVCCNPIFERCEIGQDVWGVRTTGSQGVIRFLGTASGNNGGWFKDCRIKSVGDDATCVMVAMPAAQSAGRSWVFDNTLFTHFDSTGGGAKNLNQAFLTLNSQKDIVLLHHCAAYGIDAWSSGAYETILSDMAVPAITGGLGIEPT